MWSECELREIRVFLAVAQELHFGRAADRLQITPSYVSQIVRTLETRVGGPLFDRTSRRVGLTPTGEQLLNEIAPAYQQLQDALTRAREAATGVAGTLRIGSYFTFNAGPHMTDIVEVFVARHPGCRVEFINTGYQQSYVDLLRDGELEMLATRLPLSDADMTVGPILSREERMLVVARGDPLAERASIVYEDLADRVLTDAHAVPRETMDAFVPPVTPSGRVLKRFHNRDADDIMMRVALGEQVHPTVRSFTNHLSHPGVTAVPIRDLPPSETALVWLTDNHSAKIEAFARAAADVLARTELAAYQADQLPVSETEPRPTPDRALSAFR
jgi:DNA-binding transcriptional LysR family regulator